MQAVLQQSPVAGFVVACMKTVLEHGGFDVVPFVPLFLGYVFDLLAEFGTGDILLCKIMVFAAFFPVRSGIFHRLPYFGESPLKIA